MTIQELIVKIIRQILNPAVWFIFSLGFIYFLWGVVQYVIGARGDETKLKQGKRAIMWGLIGMFIMFSAWGIVRLLCNFFESCQRDGIGGLQLPFGGGFGGSGTESGPSPGPFPSPRRQPAPTPPSESNVGPFGPGGNSGAFE